MKVCLFFQSAFNRSESSSVTSHYIYSEGMEAIYDEEFHSDINSKVLSYYLALRSALVDLRNYLEENPQYGFTSVEIYFARGKAFKSMSYDSIEDDADNSVKMDLVSETIEIIKGLPLEIIYRCQENSPAMYIRISADMLKANRDELYSQIRVKNAEQEKIKEQQRLAEQERKQALLGTRNKNYLSKNRISLVVDAGFDHNSSHGSIAGAVIHNGELITFSEMDTDFTNSTEYEHLAINKGLDTIKDLLNSEENIDIDIFSDSENTIKIITGETHAKSRQKDLLNRTYSKIKQLNGKVRFHKVKAHVPTYKANEVELIHNEVDKLATSELKGLCRHELNMDLI